MEGCSVPGVDVPELMIKGGIAKMLSDNYTLLILFFVLGAFIILVLYYFVSQLLDALKDYKKNSGNTVTVNAQDSVEEIDPDDPDAVPEDPNKYTDGNKQTFYKNVDSTYSTYNKEKTQYVKATYGKDNDDKIDNTIEYKKYDDYNYKKEDQ